MDKKLHFFKDKRVNLIGVPNKNGQLIESAEIGPKALRNSNLLKIAEELGWTATDLGDMVPFDYDDIEASNYKYGAVTNSAPIGTLCQNINKTTMQSAEEGAFTMLFGGDHGSTTGVISGLKKVQPKLKVLWIDAHGKYTSKEKYHQQAIKKWPFRISLGGFLKAHYQDLIGIRLYYNQKI